MVYTHTSYVVFVLFLPKKEKKLSIDNKKIKALLCPIPPKSHFLSKVNPCFLFIVHLPRTFSVYLFKPK